MAGDRTTTKTHHIRLKSQISSKLHLNLQLPNHSFPNSKLFFQHVQRPRPHLRRNGYIAAVVAKHLLDTGYSVRGTVRKSSFATPLIEGPLKSYFEAGTFSIVEVPDITVEGAFDESVQGTSPLNPISLAQNPLPR
jgi:hypothetical protein